MSNRFAHVVSKMHPKERADLAKALGGEQRSVLFNKYFSTVRFQAAVTGTFTYTFAAGVELRAFGYAQGDLMSTAFVGFPANRTATPSDTNLISASETISGERVVIEGISIYLHEDSDAQLAQILFPNVSVTLAMNGGRQLWPLGTLSMLPASAGLTGLGTSYVVAPDIASSVARPVGALANGVQEASNFYPLPEPILWEPKGASDSTLLCKLKVEQTCAYTTLLAADRVAAAGIAAWSHPTGTNLGTYVDLKVCFWSRQVAPRSQNA